MLDDRRMPRGLQSCRADVRHLGMAHGERPDRHFVDQPAGLEQGRHRRNRIGQGYGDGLRHERRGVVALSPSRGKFAVEDIPPVDFHGVGIDEQFVRIEPQAALGRIGPVCAKAVARSGRQARNEPRMTPPPSGESSRRSVSRLSGRVEERNPDAFRRPGPDGKADAVVRNDRPKSRPLPAGGPAASGDDARRRRPVCRAIPAISSAAESDRQAPPACRGRGAPDLVRSARHKGATSRRTCRFPKAGTRRAIRLRTSTRMPWFLLTEPSTGS